MTRREILRPVSTEYHEKARQHWGAAPCGSNYSREEYLSRRYFDEVERHRYTTHPWILQDIRSAGLQGSEVLEIGYGMGTDHLAMAREGGIMHGIDLTPANFEATARRLEIYGFCSELGVGEAENLPYPVGRFDFVYSFGVIHHSRDTAGIVSEIHRVLRQGGRCHVTVYHKHSAFFWWSVFAVDFLWRGGWRQRKLEQQLSLIEYPNDDESIEVRLFTRRELERLFRDFAIVRCRVEHLLPSDLALVSRFFRDPSKPSRLFDHMGRRLGWYLVLDAEK